MADTAPSPELWCLIQGDRRLFSVTGSDVSISKLKEAIQKRIKIDLAAHKLDLWKVNADLAEIEDDIYSGKYLFDTANKQPLRVTKKISEVWPQLPSEERLHVVVTLPGSPTLVDINGDWANSSTFSWLEEVHSKVWGRRDLTPKLFRTANVTQAHYDELQRRLKETHPDRDTPNYRGSDHNVRDIKLDVLRMANSPQRPNSNEDRVDDESRMDVDEPVPNNDGGSTITFPFTFEYLDLSTLGLSRDRENRLPWPLLIRQEYVHISRMIDATLVNRLGSMIVSGQPGTGKTAYLHLRIIQFMIKGRSFLYQDLGGTVYHINENGVRAIQSWPSGEIVAFVDGDKDEYEPSDMLFQDSVQIIIATSPKGSTGKWIEQAGGVDAIVTELWSPHELFQAGVFLYRFDISPELLKKSTEYFGYNPRRCFKSASSVQQLEVEKGVIESRITELATEERNMVRVLLSSRDDDTGVSHSIFQISPKDRLRYFFQCKFSHVSQWALDTFLETFEAQQAAAATEFYRLISLLPDAASLWGQVFKRLVFKHLAGTDAEHEFPVRGLSESESILGPTTWTFRGPIPRFKFRQEKDFIDAITNAVQNANPLHLVPSVPNFAAVDSIVYDPNEVLTFIHITVSSRHHISVTGLERIQSWLNGTLLAPLCPSKEKSKGKAEAEARNGTWRLIFIVPSHCEASFELQPLEGDAPLGEWAGKVHQYVLGLDVIKKPE